IAASEAQLSVDMLVQLRNKAIESYNELMRISL
ncbi:MAG TPA: flagellar hook-basal body complex protein FliE, partial [Lachnospiraceae bacterium]|nr:flagellar hook-basal body complex protein FliE [Lachnospiraceae bacterium]